MCDRGDQAENRVLLTRVHTHALEASHGSLSDRDLRFRNVIDLQLSAHKRHGLGTNRPPGNLLGLSAWWVVLRDFLGRVASDIFLTHRSLIDR